MPQDKTQQVMIRVTPDLAEELKRVSEREERTVAQTVRLAVRQYLDGQRIPATS